MRVLAAGAPDHGPRQTPPSTRFMTIVGQPKTIALKYATGKPVTSRINGEQQMLYTLTSGEKAYFPLNVAQAIDSLTLAPGQPFIVCHYGGGNWDVDRAPVPMPQPAPPPTPQPPLPPTLPPAASTQTGRAPAPQPPRYWGNAHQAGPAATSPETDTPAPRVASSHFLMNGAGEDTAMILERCYECAIEITVAAFERARAQGLQLLPTHEGLQACAATLFIAETRRLQ